LENARVLCFNTGMTRSTARFYFWFYGYPKPKAEDGSRSV
jgi:hypothetical protein